MSLRVCVAAALAAASAIVPLSTASAGAVPAAASNTSHAVAVSGYHISVLARGTSTLYKPDSILVVGAHVWVGYQNGGDPTGANGIATTLVEYNMNGTTVRTVKVPQHNDGLGYDPATHMIWATSNEDANPLLSVINPQTGAITTYHFGVTAHGGGYDDVAFTGGKAFIADSNPDLNKAGVNVGPALSMVSMDGGKPSVTPLVMGNATATDMTTGKSTTINMIDPDSMTVDPRGNLVLDNQGGAMLLFVHHPGTAQQSLHALPVGTQVDDTAWATSAMGTLFVVDARANVVYRVTSSFKPGTVFTETPSDSGVAGFVGTLDLKTGIITPVIIGLGSATGLVFASGM